MAGHSKWANIQHRKGRQDEKRGKIFTKLIREITVSSRLAGPDPSSNPRLRTAIDSALSYNMPRDTIDRAIKRGAGNDESSKVDEIRYEGYGPGGVAIMLDCMTDNKNRTVAEVRHLLTKFGGNLGTDGSVAYLFTKVGLLSYTDDVDEDKLLEVAMEAGAYDIISDDSGTIEILTEPDLLGDVQEKISADGFPPQHADVTMRAETLLTLEPATADKTLQLLERLYDLDDVQKVYANIDLPDDVLAQAGYASSP